MICKRFQWFSQWTVQLFEWNTVSFSGEAWNARLKLSLSFIPDFKIILLPKDSRHDQTVSPQRAVSPITDKPL